MKDWEKLKECLGEEKFQLVEYTCFLWSTATGEDLKSVIYEHLLKRYSNK